MDSTRPFLLSGIASEGLQLARIFLLGATFYRLINFSFFIPFSSCKIYNILIY